MKKIFFVLPVIFAFTLIVSCGPSQAQLEKAMDNPDEFSALIDEMKDVDKGFKYDKTLLQIALERNNPIAAGLLIDRGADPLKRVDYEDVLFWGFHFKSMEALAIIFEKRPDLLENPEIYHDYIWQALDTGATDILELFFTRGVPIDGEMNTGATYLRYAVEQASYEHPDLIQFLLDRGANPHIINGDGQSLLFPVASPEAMVALLEAGCDPNISDAKGHTAAFYHTAKKMLELVKILLRYGAVPEPGMFIIETWEQTFTTTSKGWVDNTGKPTVKILKDYSYETIHTTSTVNHENTIPLLEYAEKNDPELAEMLKELGYGYEL
ncbi:MAG: hypothetical protein JEY99_08245 [Spirochaetales bacterium]|nr:hypothetical protein [Spirochaetales bacterium]